MTWTDSPPQLDGYQCWRYEPIPVGRAVIGRVVTQIHGINTHWLGQTVPCVAPAADCPQCRTRGSAERRWTGYLGVRTSRQQIIVLAAETCREYAEVLQAGYALKFERHHARKPVRITPVGEPVHCARESLVPALIWMWRRYLNTIPGGVAALEGPPPTPVAGKATGNSNYVSVPQPTPEAPNARRRA